MKKTLLATLTAVTIATASIAGIAYADGGKGPEGAVERLTEKLGLTTEQQAQLKVLFDQRIADRKAMQENLTQEQRENMRENARDGMRDQMHAQIKSVLTEEQLAKFDQMHANEGKGKGKGDRHERGEGGHGGKGGKH